MNIAQVGTLETNDETNAEQTMIAGSEKRMSFPNFLISARRILFESGMLVIAAAIPNEASYLEFDVLDERLLIREPPDYDLIFTLFEQGGGKEQPIMLETAYIAVPPGHRLMTRQAVPLRELVGERLFVSYADEVFPSFARNRQPAERFTNGRITVVRVPSVESALLMVELKVGIAIVTASILSSTCPNVKIVGILEGDCDFQVFLHRNESQDNPAAQLFVEEFVNTPNPLGRV